MYNETFSSDASYGCAHSAPPMRTRTAELSTCTGNIECAAHSWPSAYTLRFVPRARVSGSPLARW